MTIYKLTYRKNEKDTNVSAPIGLYSSFENAQTAGERLFKNITGQEDFHWTVGFIRFDGENGTTSCIDIVPVKVDSVLL